MGVYRAALLALDPFSKVFAFNKLPSCAVFGIGGVPAGRGGSHSRKDF
jgi:hypothetical protein